MRHAQGLVEARRPNADISSSLRTLTSRLYDDYRYAVEVVSSSQVVDSVDIATFLESITSATTRLDLLTKILVRAEYQPRMDRLKQFMQPGVKDDPRYSEIIQNILAVYNRSKVSRVPATGLLDAYKHSLLACLNNTVFKRIDVILPQDTAVYKNYFYRHANFVNTSFYKNNINSTEPLLIFVTNKIAIASDRHTVPFPEMFIGFSMAFATAGRFRFGENAHQDVNGYFAGVWPNSSDFGTSGGGSNSNPTSRIHPHVSDSRVCLGDGAANFGALFQAGSFFEAATITLAVLSTYNAGSPYTRLEYFNGSRCPNCNTATAVDFEMGDTAENARINPPPASTTPTFVTIEGAAVCRNCTFSCYVSKALLQYGTGQACNKCRNKCSNLFMFSGVCYKCKFDEVNKLDIIYHDPAVPTPPPRPVVDPSLQALLERSNAPSASTRVNNTARPIARPEPAAAPQRPRPIPPPDSGFRDGEEGIDQNTLLTQIAGVLTQIQNEFMHVPEVFFNTSLLTDERYLSSQFLALACSLFADSRFRQLITIDEKVQYVNTKLFGDFFVVRNTQAPVAPRVNAGVGIGVGVDWSFAGQSVTGRSRPPIPSMHVQNLLTPLDSALTTLLRAAGALSSPQMQGASLPATATAVDAPVTNTQ